MLSWWICDVQLQSARNAVEAWLVLEQPVGFYRTSMVLMVTGDFRVLCRLSQTCRMWEAFRHMGCMRCDVMHTHCNRVSRCLPGSWEPFWEHEGHLRQRASICWPCHRLAVQLQIEPGRRGQNVTGHGRRYCPECDMWPSITDGSTHVNPNCPYIAAWRTHGSAPLSAGRLGLWSW